MRLTKLKVQDFRNLSEAAVTPGQLTIFYGDNGQGKTNLLESIWLLTGGKSFRGAKDAELVNREKEFAVIEAEFEGGNRPQTMRLTIGKPESARPGRMAKLNGVDRGRAASVAGNFTAVVFEPNHLSLVKGGPGGRRQFLDAALCQLYPGYLQALRRYARIITQKNALLKAYDITPGSDVLLETFNEDLVTCGTEVMLRRSQYLARLAPLASANYQEISRGAESLELCYAPCCGSSALPPQGETWDKEATANALRQKLQEMQRAEQRAGFSLAGPHREDLEIRIGGQEGKIYGSQGQQRSAVLSIKLAEASCAGEITGEQPVMLLDDVLSELDDGRQAYLLTRMEDKQTFVTTCDSAAFQKTDGKLIRVQNGTVQEWQTEQ